MKNKKILILVAFLGAAFQVVTGTQAQSKVKLPKNLSGLNGPFHLGGESKPETRYYIQETRYVHIGFDGKRTGMETYRVKMCCVPAALSGKEGDEYTIGGFSIQSSEKEAETIPSLNGWSYVLRITESGKDDQGQIFGIPHSRFENLTTSGGKKLAAAESYPVYNSLIDFHSFNDVFARPMSKGGGIQDLKEIGQKIVHASAFSEPPVNLGKGIKEGSVFRNGEITLQFKGIGVLDGTACAVVGYDSGESTLRMLIPMTSDKDIEVVGGSEYLGDLYIDLSTNWLRKATLDEFVINETRIPAMSQEAADQKIRAYTVRHLTVHMISREEYEKQDQAGQTAHSRLPCTPQGSPL